MWDRAVTCTMVELEAQFPLLLVSGLVAIIRNMKTYVLFLLITSHGTR